MKSDLTENDLIIRQINVSKIVDRIFKEQLAMGEKANLNEPFDFEKDFYGTRNYWFKIAISLKIINLIYIILYIPYRLSVVILGIFSPLDKLNTVLQLKKKRKSFKSCE